MSNPSINTSFLKQVALKMSATMNWLGNKAGVYQAGLLGDKNECYQKVFWSLKKNEARGDDFS